MSQSCVWQASGKGKFYKETSHYDFRGNITRSKVIGGQIVSYTKSNCYWYGCPFSNCSCINSFAPITAKFGSCVIWEPSCYDTLWGHLTWSKVIGGKIVSCLTSNFYSYGWVIGSLWAGLYGGSIVDVGWEHIPCSCCPWKECIEVIISTAEWNLVSLSMYVMSFPVCWGEVAASIKVNQFVVYLIRIYSRTSHRMKATADAWSCHSHYW